MNRLALSCVLAFARAASSSLAASTAAETDSSMDMGPWSDVEYLEGTWCSKSGMVVTGPDFYDPVHELLIDPGLPGYSYSFTNDGYWEEAIYQITSDGTKPECPKAALIFQHGTYEVDSSGRLILTPFGDDGRILSSDPCGQGSTSSYDTYVQTETFKQFEVLIDNYHGRYRLNLYEWDGTPMQPLWLTYKPPQMLPTMTMNPANSSDVNNSTGTTGARARVRRSLENRRRLASMPNVELRKNKISYDVLWYSGISMILAGGVGFVFLS